MEQRHFLSILVNVDFGDMCAKTETKNINLTLLSDRYKSPLFYVLAHTMASFMSSETCSFASRKNNRHDFICLKDLLAAVLLLFKAL